MFFILAYFSIKVKLRIVKTTNTILLDKKNCLVYNNRMHEKVCKDCGCLFITKYKLKVYCSKKCKYNAWCKEYELDSKKGTGVVDYRKQFEALYSV
jgi:hypothetical protein